MSCGLAIKMRSDHHQRLGHILCPYCTCRACSMRDNNALLELISNDKRRRGGRSLSSKKLLSVENGLFLSLDSIYPGLSGGLFRIVYIHHRACHDQISGPLRFCYCFPSSALPLLRPRSNEPDYCCMRACVRPVSIDLPNILMSIGSAVAAGDPMMDDGQSWLSDLPLCHSWQGRDERQVLHRHCTLVDLHDHADDDK